MNRYCEAGKNHVWIRAMDTGPMAQLCCSLDRSDIHRYPLDNVSDFLTLLDSAEWKKKYDVLEKERLDECSNCHKADQQKKDSQRRKINSFCRNGKFFLKIDFSNKCNLKCLMCSSARSTSWIKDEHQLKKDLDWWDWEPIKYSTLGDDWWHNLSNSFWNNVGTVEISGGEPLYQEDAIAFLEFFACSYPDIKIRIITNATLLNDNVIKIFTKIKRLDVLTSVDAWDDKIYKYSRGGVHSLDKIKENLKIINSIATRHAVVDTLHPVNYDQSFVGKQWLMQNGLEVDYHASYVFSPDFLDPRKVIPANLLPGKKDYKLMKRFKEFILVLDKIRNTNIFDIRPEFEKWFKEIG